MAPIVKKNTKQHITHPEHPLLDIYEDKEYLCDGCKTPGFGKKYRCDSCDFDLHEYCATCPATLSSFMHPKHQLNLVSRKPQASRQIDRVCNVCGDEVEGMFYRCKLCEFDVHPVCTQLPQNVRTELHPAHPVTLQPSKANSHCFVCKRLCTYWIYRCGICRVDIHLECVLEPCHDDDDDYESYQRPVSPPIQPPPPPKSPPTTYNAYAYVKPSGLSPFDMDDHSNVYGVPSGFNPYGMDNVFGMPSGFNPYNMDNFYGMPSGFNPNGMNGHYHHYGIPFGFNPKDMYGGYHDYGMPSGSRSYDMKDHGIMPCGSSPSDMYPYPNLNQVQQAGGATNGKKTKTRKMFALVGKLALGVLGTTVLGVPGLAAFI